MAFLLIGVFVQPTAKTFTITYPACDHIRDYDVTDWQVGNNFINVFDWLYYPWQGEEGTFEYWNENGVIYLHRYEPFFEEKKVGIVIDSTYDRSPIPEDDVLVAILEACNIEKLSKFPNLISASIYGADSCFKGIEGYQRIKALRLECKDAALKYIARLENLKELNLYGVEEISGAGLAYFYKHRNLRLLDLSSTGITDANLVYIKGIISLEELDLFNTAVTDRALVHVAGLSNLKSLSLAWTQVTDAGMEYLVNLGNLEVLDLGKTRITDHGLESLVNLTNLKMLYVEETAITNKGLELITRLHDIEGLDIYHTKITSEGVQYLARLQNLRWLYIGDIGVADEDLHYLEKLPNLEGLSLEGCSVTDKGLKTLARMKNLEWLLIYSPYVTEAGIDMLEEALPDCWIRFM